MLCRENQKNLLLVLGKFTQTHVWNRYRWTSWGACSVCVYVCVCVSVFVCTHNCRCCKCVYLCATKSLLDLCWFALVGSTGGLLLAELDVSVGCTLVKPPLTVRALNIVWGRWENIPVAAPAINHPAGYMNFFSFVSLNPRNGTMPSFPSNICNFYFAVSSLYTSFPDS